MYQPKVEIKKKNTNLSIKVELQERIKERERESIHLFVWEKHELNERENSKFL